jgi:hypothetical protein
VTGTALSHSIYGLRVRPNVGLAGLQALPACEGHDVALEIGTLPDAAAPRAVREPIYVSAEQDSAGRPSLVASRLASGSFFELAYADGTRVVLDAGATRMWATAEDQATLEDTAAYLLGPAMGFALSLRGTTSLHASVVGFGDRAVAFAGPEGAGKSTLAAAFAHRGYRVLGDDIAPLVDHGSRFAVHPSYPRVRLWPESVELLFGAADALPRISETWDKRYLSLDGGDAFATGPLPLAAIYLLAPREELAAPRIEAIEVRDALMGLVRYSYAARLLDRARRAAEFELLGRVAQHVPVRRLVPSTGPSRLEATCELIAADLAE